jgi:hypothetical protein
VGHGQHRSGDGHAQGDAGREKGQVQGGALDVEDKEGQRGATVGCVLRRSLPLHEDDRGGYPLDPTEEGAGQVGGRSRDNAGEDIGGASHLFLALVEGHDGDLALGGGGWKSRACVSEVE